MSILSLPGLPKAFLDDLMAGRVKRRSNGLYFPRKDFLFTGWRQFARLSTDTDDNWTDCGHNLLTTEGMNYLLNAGVHGATPVTTWYCAPFGSNVAPVVGLTAATFASTQGELTTQYSESTRPEYVEAAASSASMTNAASAAVITAATDNVTIYGVGLISVATKAATTGTLLCANLFRNSGGTPVAFTLPAAGGTLNLAYVLTGTATADS